MDDIDRKLMAALVGGARATLAALGETVGLTAPAVHERMHKLEASGAIRGYSALVDPERMGSGTAALVFLRLDGDRVAREGLETHLASDPCVLELHEVAGEDCYVAKVRVDSPQRLAEFLGELRDFHHGLTSRSSVVLRSCFERPLLWPTDRPAPVRSPTAGRSRAGQ
ncbi:MAG: Lrp/AsnC family transcriptional regulator [Candidatus Dormibacteria bacterium]